MPNDRVGRSGRRYLQAVPGTSSREGAAVSESVVSASTRGHDFGDAGPFLLSSTPLNVR